MWTTSPGTLLPLNSFLIVLNLEKDLSPARAVSDHQSKKEGSAWLDKLRTTNLRHQIQTRFCHFCCFPASLGKTWAVASWQSYFCFLFKLINIFSDLLSMGAVQTCASTQ